MKFSLEEKQNLKVKIKIELSPQEFEDYYCRARDALAKKLHIKGFRDGEVPSQIAEKELGGEKILQKASLLAIQESYPKALTKSTLEFIGEPRVRIMKLARGEPFIFEVNISTLPEINLPDYREITKSIKREKIKVEEKEIAESLDWLRNSRSRSIPLERGARKGDLVEIEYSSPDIEGGKVFQDKFFLGRGSFLEDFEKEIEGMKKGEEKEISVTFPQDYSKKELRGKTTKFKLKVKSVSEIKLPEINDDFARSLGNFKDLASLKKSIREGILLEKKEAEKKRLIEEILQKILKSVSFNIPEILLAVEKERLLKNLKEGVEKNLQIEFSEYLKQIKKEPEEIDTMLSQMAQENVKKWLIIREIGKREKIVVLDKEVEERINEILKNYPEEKEVRKKIDLERLKSYTKEEIRNKKVLDLLEDLIP